MSRSVVVRHRNPSKSVQQGVAEPSMSQGPEGSQSGSGQNPSQIHSPLGNPRPRWFLSSPSIQKACSPFWASTGSFILIMISTQIHSPRWAVNGEGLPEKTLPQ